MVRPLCNCGRYPCPTHDPVEYQQLTLTSALERIMEIGPGPAFDIAKKTFEDIYGPGGGVEDHTPEVIAE